MTMGVVFLSLMVASRSIQQQAIVLNVKQHFTLKNILIFVRCFQQDVWNIQLKLDAQNAKLTIELLETGQLLINYGVYASNARKI